jgi:hypothetical protein
MCCDLDELNLQNEVGRHGGLALMLATARKPWWSRASLRCPSSHGVSSSREDALHHVHDRSQKPHHPLLRGFEKCADV